MSAFARLYSVEASPALLKSDSAPVVSCGERQSVTAFDVANKLTLIFSDRQSSVFERLTQGVYCQLV